MAKEWYEEEGAEVEVVEGEDVVEVEVVEGEEAEAAPKHTLTNFRDQIVAEFEADGRNPKDYIDAEWESIRERMFAEFPDKLRSAPNQRRKLIGQFNIAWKAAHPAGEEVDGEEVEEEAEVEEVA